MSEKIIVIGETRDGELRNVTFEAIAAAKQIKADAEIVGVLCGDEDLQSQGQEMIYYGADRIITVQHENLKTYTSEGFGQAVKAIIDEENPTGIVMGHTSIGQDLTPKLARNVKTSLISNAVESEADWDQAVFTSPSHSGKAFEKKVVTSGTVFATIRPSNIPMLEKEDSRSGDIEAKDIDMTDMRT